MVTYIKKLIVFYLVSFLLGGVMFFIVSFANVKNVMTANGVFYFEIPIYLFLVSSLVCHFFINFFSCVYSHNKKTCYKTVNVCLNGNAATILCLVDTGNLLKDPITNESVIICELDAIKNIFSQKTYDFFKDYLCDIKDEIEELKIRVIPFTSLGNENGFLLGFKPDFVFIGGEVKGNVIIGVYNKKLSNNHNYNALIGC
jgi:stage II sporulation protein GA (sporulation sigma-E factor processing peptidase)